MRRVLLGWICFAMVGCSTAPVAGFLDLVAPGGARRDRIPRNDLPPDTNSTLPPLSIPSVPSSPSTPGLQPPSLEPTPSNSSPLTNPTRKN